MSKLGDIISAFLMMAVIWAATFGCVYMCWQWFLLPLGAPDISFWHIIGLGFTFNVMTKRAIKDPDTGDVSKDMQQMTMAALLMFGVAYLLSLGV